MCTASGGLSPDLGIRRWQTGQKIGVASAIVSDLYFLTNLRASLATLMSYRAVNAILFSSLLKGGPLCSGQVAYFESGIVAHLRPGMVVHFHRNILEPTRRDILIGKNRLPYVIFALLNDLANIDSLDRRTCGRIEFNRTFRAIEIDC